MIIVEGPDGSGKTSLIRHLQYTDRRVYKSLRGGVGGTTPEGWALPNESALDAYRREIGILAPGHVALDRFHLSERVYGPLLRRSQEVTDDVLYRVNGLLHALHVPVILCLPPLDITLGNVLQEGRERPAYQTKDFLRRAYWEFQRLAPYATVVYDYTRDTLPKV